MSANILVVEYEQRYVESVRGAISGAGHRLEFAPDLDRAVEICAHFEPRLVIITSVLPRLKIEDAITQLRARAGLRVTPFLILMSGYMGTESKADASRYGAQDILARPFDTDVLGERVQHLLATAVSPAATQAIPQDTLDAFRKAAQRTGGEASLTSDDLFGEIVSDVERAAQDIAAPPEKPRAGEQDVEQALAEVIEDSRLPPPIRRLPTAERDVDDILSETLSGLDIDTRKVPPAPPPTPADPPPMEPEAPTEIPSADAEPPTEAVPFEPAPPPESAPVEEAPDEIEIEFVEEESDPEIVEETEEAEGVAEVEEAAPVVSVEPAVAGTQFGQYLLQEHVATGGMAEVYRARMMGVEGFQKTVAIKRIVPHLTDNEDFVSMFIDEAKLAAQLNHNNIIHIYDLGKIDRSYYIAMEYIEGRDLRSVLKECADRGARIPIPLSLYTATLLASALDYAHRKRDFENRELGLVHRDVSPQNVLISSDGDIKLCDFGIAKAASKASTTRTGALKGKIQYMSPEQARGKDIDHRSDIFSLGVVVHEMLTGDRLFAGASDMSVLEQVREPQIEPPSATNPDVTPPVDRIVMRALETDRDKRYQSARDLQRDLEGVMRTNGWAPDSATVQRFLVALSSDQVEAVEIPVAGEPTPAPALTAEAVDAAVDELVEAVPEPEPVAAASSPERRSRRVRPLLWALLAAAVVVGAVAGWLMFFSDGGFGRPPTPTPMPLVVAPEEPTPTTTPSEADLIARAGVLAEAELARQEEELRRRLEKEFPTPTALPPTATATATSTATDTPTETFTPEPPTRTPIPPTSTPIPSTPTPSVREGDLVVPGAGVVRPVLIHQVDPAYPPVARNLRIDGAVEVETLVGPNGTIEDIRILSVSRPGVGFEKATEDALRQWRYKPATKNGVRVRMWVRIRVPFRYR